MATRTISTKLAVEGESEYRASMTRINGEIKTMQSSLKLVESEFRNNANTMEALTSKGNALNDLYKKQEDKVGELQRALDNARQSEKLYADIKDELTKAIKENEKALDELENSTEDTAEEQERLTAENKELNEELQRNEGYLTAAHKGVTNWEGTLNTAKTKLNDLDAELKLNDQYLEEAKNSADGCATSIDQFGQRTKQSDVCAADLRNTLASAGLIEALKKTADAMMACVDANVEFESAMTGVKKTTDLTEVELASMADGIQALATQIPATTTEIAGVAEAAGQLGISSEDILSFTEVMVNLGVATNLSSEEAASSLAKFANVVKMSADDYEKLGSVIVGLGNNFATTESDIVSMATRLASTGEIVGLTEPQIMAIATALSSVGIEAEAGGSAISKLLKQFETMVATGDKSLSDFASVAGMTAEEFSKAWGEDAVSALSMFINGLGDMDAEGGSAVAMLDDLGIKEVRLSNAVLALASSDDILTQAVKLANNAWEENTALAKEAATRYETTESKLQLLANSADNVKIAIGDQLTPTIGELAETGIDVLNWLADFIEEADAIVPVLSGVVAALGAFTAAATVMAVAASGVGTALAAAASAALANPFVLTATAVAGLGVAIATLSENAESAVPDVEDLTTAADELNTTMEESGAACDATIENTVAAASVAEKYISRLEELQRTGWKTDEQQKEYHNTLALLCQVVPDLAQYIDLQNDKIEGGTDALRANTEAWKQNAIQQAYQEKITELQKKHSDVVVEQEMNTIRLTDAKERAKEAEEKYTAAIEESNDVMAWAEQETQRLYEQTGELGDAHALAAEKQAELQSAIDQYSEEMVTARNEAAAYQEAIDADSEAVAAAKEELTLAQQAVDELTGAMGENSQAAVDNAAVQEECAFAIQEVQTQIDDLAESYKDAYEAAIESFEGQFGLFDKASTTTETYLSSTVKNAQLALDSQLEYWNDYDANIDTLQSYTAEQLGLTHESYDALMTYISDGSEEAAGLAASMVKNIDSGNAEAVANLAETVAEVAAKRQEVADETAQWKVDLKDAIAQIEQAAADADFSGVDDALIEAFEETPVLLKLLGTEAVSNYAEGIDSNAGTVAESAETMAEEVVEATSAPLEENGEDIGETYVADVQRGVEGEAPNLVNTVEDVAKKSVKSYTEEFGKISAQTQTKLTELKNTINNTTSSMPNGMYTVGQETINGMIRGMNNRSGALYSTVRSIVNNAIGTAKKTAGVNSPSTVTTEMFEYVGDGMVLGLENRRKKIKDTAKSVVNDALALDVSDKINSTISSIDPTVSLDIDSAVRASAGVETATTTVQHNYGGMTFQIYQQPGEDAESFAYRVLDIIQTETEKEEAAIGR